MNRSLTKSLVSVLAGISAGISLGCLINVGSGSQECGSPLSHSQIVGDDCVCDAGYEFEDPNDPDNFECDRIPPKPDSGQCDEPNSHPVTDGCQCDAGYNWCSDDPNDYTCCVDPNQNPDGTGTDSDATDTLGTGTDTGMTTDDPTVADSTGTDTGDDMQFDPDPADCTAETEGVLFCSNTSIGGLDDSRYYVCMGGAWVEDTTAVDESCAFDQFDFGYGCITNNEAGSIEFICGFGPGTDCEPGGDDVCVDTDVINGCLFGKLTQDSCATICNTIGDEEGATYDSGFCDASAGPAECICCDSGEEGCPV